MSRPIIEVENLSKCYRLGAIGATSLRDSFDRFSQRLRGQTPKTDAREFWALRDVSFSVQPGEVVGIIGRNGAGKSTLLKILSRITEPTSGRAILRGRVASLLEVGTGFHPDLTGRENVFLNGAILGMSRAEVRQKFDEIVAFAEVEKFIDTPVKHYSSGMYVRLAFAVAAHLEPEILIVDEVLAVGDATFQNKCINKMKNVATDQGRTVLFVSHNIQAVRQLCSTTVFMANGRVELVGDTTATIARYLGNNQSGGAEIALGDYPRNTSPHKGRLELIQYRDPDGRPMAQCDRAKSLHVRVVVKLTAPAAEFDFAMAVTHADGIKVFSETWSDEHSKLDLPAGLHGLSFIIPGRFLKVGSYSIALCALNKGQVIDFIDGLPAPEITDLIADKNIEAHRWGLVRIPISWLPVETL